MTSDEACDAELQDDEERTQLYMGKGNPKGLGKGSKGKGKGKKGKLGKGGFRDHQHKHIAPQLTFDGPRKSSSKGKGKNSQYVWQ